MVQLGVLAVLGLNVYAALLVVLRARIWRVRLYRPMLVNIGLSVAPVVVSLVLVVAFVGLVSGTVRLGVPQAGPVVAVLVLVLAGGTWVLLFPNAEYLITELNLSHREAQSPVPLWFDIVQTLTLTLSGIANALVSLALVQLFAVVIVAPNATGPVPPAPSWAVAALVLVLGGIGVYLGRYLRFNSVDARHPVRLVRKLAAYLDTRARRVDLLAFVLTHTVLLAIVYVPLFAGIYRLVAA